MNAELFDKYAPDPWRKGPWKGEEGAETWSRAAVLLSCKENFYGEGKEQVLNKQPKEGGKEKAFGKSEPNCAHSNF